MKIILAISVSLIAIGARAETDISYRAIGQSENEFRAQKLAHSASISYDEYLAENPVPAALKENLTNAFIAAQEQFLKSELVVIENYWRDVTAFALKADWGPIHREMIQVAFMRLAQTSLTPAETRKNLLSAIEFDDKYNPERKLFPPPLVEAYEALRYQTTKFKIQLKQAEGFTLLLINGTPHRLAALKPLEITPGVKRVTYLSPSFEPITRILDTEDIASFAPQKNLLPALSKSTKSERPNLEPDFFTPSIEQKMPKSDKSNFYEKPKFWLSAAVVTGAILIVNGLNEEKNGSQPSHREGL